MSCPFSGSAALWRRSSASRFASRAGAVRWQAGARTMARMTRTALRRIAGRLANARGGGCHRSVNPGEETQTAIFSAKECGRGMGSPLSRRLSRCSSMASRISARTSSRDSPTATHPGRSGTYTPMDVSPSSTMTTYSVGSIARPGPQVTLFALMDSRRLIHSLFGADRALIGTIHAQALPGTPASRLAVDAIARAAAAEAEIYADAGFHGLILENTHDRPYLKGAAVGPEIVSAMSVVGAAIRRATPLPLGIQVLAGANRAAMAVAQACGATFVRVEGFVFAHVADEGIIESSAGDILRYRRAIGADDVLVFADIKKKHSAHAITADVDIVETAKAAEFFSVDGVIVSGTATGSPADESEVEVVSRAVGVPTLIGSGITPENIARY